MCWWIIISKWLNLFLTKTTVPSILLNAMYLRLLIACIETTRFIPWEHRIRTQHPLNQQTLNTHQDIQTCIGCPPWPTIHKTTLQRAPSNNSPTALHQTTAVKLEPVNNLNTFLLTQLPVHNALSTSTRNYHKRQALTPVSTRRRGRAHCWHNYFS